MEVAAKRVPKARSEANLRTARPVLACAIGAGNAGHALTQLRRLLSIQMGGNTPS